MTDQLKQAAMQQALKLIERLNLRGWILADFEDEVYASIASLKAALKQQPVQRCALCNYQHGHQIGCKNNPMDIALVNLAQPPLPEQQDSCFCHDGVSLQIVSGGAAPEGYLGKVTLLIDGKYVDYVKAQRKLLTDDVLVPQAEPVGEVVEVNNDGFRCEFSQRLAVGTKLYTFPPAAQPEQEPVAWVCMKGENHDIDFEEADINKLPIGSLLYAAPLAAQRPWQGMTEQDMPSGENPMFDHEYFCAGMVYAAKVLQNKNHG